MQKATFWENSVTVNLFTNNKDLRTLLFLFCERLTVSFRQTKYILESFLSNHNRPLKIEAGYNGYGGHKMCGPRCVSKENNLPKIWAEKKNFWNTVYIYSL